MVILKHKMILLISNIKLFNWLYYIIKSIVCTLFLSGTYYSYKVLIS